MGFLEKFKNAMVEKDPDLEAAAQRSEEEQTIATAWAWLRQQLDRACWYYQASGDPNHPEGPLSGVLSGGALTEMIAYLDQLRAHGVMWSFPNRDQVSNQRIKVEEPAGSSYVVVEYFRDFSVMQLIHDGQPVDQRQADGREQALRAVITPSGNDYYITEVVMLAETDGS